MIYVHISTCFPENEKNLMLTGLPAIKELNRYFHRLCKPHNNCLRENYQPPLSK